MNQNLAVLKNFEFYLDQFRIPYGHPSNNATHTCMANIYKKKGAFIVPDEKEEEFFNEYIKVVFENGIPISLTERPLKEKGILKFDFDFKYHSDTLERKYDSEKSITFLVETILGVLKKITTEKSHEMELDSYVFQRKEPYFQKEKLVKDGVHIIYPYYYVHFSIHYLIRQMCIEEFHKNGLNKMFFYENSINEIVDEAVIENSGWLMHGSTKENISPYK